MATVEIRTTTGPLVIISLPAAICTLDDTLGNDPIINQIRTADRRVTTVVRRAQSTDPVQFEHEFRLVIRELPGQDFNGFSGALTLLQFMKDHLDEPLLIRDNNSIDHTDVIYISGLKQSFAQFARGQLRDSDLFSARLIFQNVESA